MNTAVVSWKNKIFSSHFYRGFSKFKQTPESIESLLNFEMTSQQVVSQE